MKKQSFKEITSKTVSELRKEIKRIYSETMKMKMEESVSPSKNTHTLRQKRKDLAQVYTVLNGKLFAEKSIKEEKKGAVNG